MRCNWKKSVLSNRVITSRNGLCRQQHVVERQANIEAIVERKVTIVASATKLSNHIHFLSHQPKNKQDNSIRKSKMKHYPIIETQHLRHGVLVKKDKDGNIFLGNRAPIPVFATAIKVHEPITNAQFADMVKCVEFDGEYSPRSDSTAIATMVKSLVNLYGNTIEEIRFRNIDVNMQGMACLVSGCPNLTTLYFVRAAVKSIIKRRIQGSYWQEIRRGHSVCKLVFTNCELVHSHKFIEVLSVSKKTNATLTIQINEPKVQISKECLDAYNALTKESCKPQKGRKLELNIFHWNHILKTKVNSTVFRDNDSHELVKQKTIDLARARKLTKKLNKILSDRVNKRSLHVVAGHLHQNQHSFTSVYTILQNRPDLAMPRVAKLELSHSKQKATETTGIAIKRKGDDQEDAMNAKKSPKRQKK